ncbi:MAG: hypothetical protein BWK80_43685 [Desulfobacteraceae bacterium IS3]|nr:MAG: hypothetical protein BWK80_43685 [Desulfobacteraceae bacterium IS3]
MDTPPADLFNFYELYFFPIRTVNSFKKGIIYMPQLNLKVKNNTAMPESRIGTSFRNSPYGSVN